MLLGSHGDRSQSDTGVTGNARKLISWHWVTMKVFNQDSAETRHWKEGYR